ncbi:MAG: NAD-dependent epimerase [Spirochaetia bacterium]|jgi:UDP-glucuronate 4-epimerase|nr:NAD-dependent epimerase [Spirochaetia bacterium]
MKVLVTGCAGFIGYFTARALIERGFEVTGIDSINSYYDTSLKSARLSLLGIDGRIPEGQMLASKTLPGFSFIKLDLAEREALSRVFSEEKPGRVCHLAAQAGVRYSIENPWTYIDSNITGFLNILECCRAHGTEHLVFASSSSVYGLNESMPFKTSDNVDHPVSLYAATKKSNELMAHTYSHLYGIPATGLRFFTVYGPLGRPDMAYFSFTKSIFENKPISVYNHGDMLRDFTYVDDVVESIVRILDTPPMGNKNWSGLTPDPSSSPARYAIYNIGNGSPVKLADFIELIERAAGRKAGKIFLPMQPGDVYATFADVSGLAKQTGYAPGTPLNVGIERFVEWYRQFYGNPVS